MQSNQVKFQGRAAQDLFADYFQRLPEDTLERVHAVTSSLGTSGDSSAVIRKHASEDPTVALIAEFIDGEKGSDVLLDFKNAARRFFRETRGE